MKNDVTYAKDWLHLFQRFPTLSKLTMLLFLFSILQSLPSPGYAKNKKNKVRATKMDKGTSIRKIIHARVTDESGDPLIGATVSVVGTNNGTITNAEGQFSLDVDPDATLRISYLGYDTKEVNAGDMNGKVIQLKQSKAIAGDSVVVVGYGVQKKITVTGAISSVPMDLVEQTATPNLSTAIAGKVPGLLSRQPSGEPGFDQTQIYIRGLATFGVGADQAPLVLVDGIERDMNTINPQEVQSITILKDASATAVFGTRGANGVILITTKSGKVSKPQVTFRTEHAMMTRIRAPQYINGGEYASLINENRLEEQMGDPSIQLKYTPDEIKKFYDQSDPYFYPSVDWTDAVMKKSTYQTINNLSVSGGNLKLRYYLNLGYTEEEGLWKQDPKVGYNSNSTVHRYDLRSKVNVNITKDLEMDLALGVIFSQNNHPGYSTGAIFNALQYISPIQFPIFNPDGTIAGSIVNNLTNPWEMVSNSGYNVDYNNETQATLGVNWDLSDKITKGLSLNGLFGYDHNAYGEADRLISNEIKHVIGIDSTTGQYLYQVDYEGRGQMYSTAATMNRSFYVQGEVNYNRSFGRQSVTGMMMANLRNAVDILAPLSINNLPAKRVGFASRLTYDYDNRYLLEFDAGYNGSENFAKGHRFGFFPAVSGGWFVSHEKFWNPESFFSSLKLRGSYGLIGNDQIGGQRFMYETTYNTQNTNFYTFGLGQSPISGIEEGQIGNPDVTWEKSKKADIGLDMGFFNSALTWQVDLFQEDRRDILLQRNGTIPLVSGFLPYTLPFANLGRVFNHGIESLMEFRKSGPSSGFSYSFRGNFTYARNHIVDDDEPTLAYPYQSLKGLPIGTTLGYIAVGFFKNQADIDKSPKQTFTSVVLPGDVKYKDVNGDGVIDSKDMVPLGYPRLPEIIYGFGGTVGYKNFDVSVYFMGATHTTYFFSGPSVYIFSQGEGTYNVLKYFYDHRWIPGADNTNAEYPAVRSTSALNNYVPSTLYMKDGSYLRLKTAEIGYNFPKRLLNRIKISNIRAFVNGTNLFTIDKLKIVDPESDNGSGGYPLQRVLNAGFQVTF